MISPMLSFLIVWCLALSATALEFTYADQAAWPMLPESQCGGRRQSPIDINLANVLVNPRLSQNLACTWQHPHAVITGPITNTGRTIEMDVEAPHICVGVPGTGSAQFRLAQVHIHLGAVNNEGSEHRVNGRLAALEMHLVHFDTRLADLNAAKLHPNGIMVTALLFDSVAEGLANCELSKLATVTAAALQKPEARLGYHIRAQTLLKGTGVELAHERFFTYQGSLTTPGCNEVVTWIVAAHRGLIGHQTLQLLRAAPALSPGTVIAPNFRQVQPLNGRNITCTFKPVLESAAPGKPATTSAAVNNAKKRPPTLEPVNNATSQAPALEPVNNATAQAPAVEPVNNATAQAPALEPVNNATTQAPALEPANTAQPPALEKVNKAHRQPPALDKVQKANPRAPALKKVNNAHAQPPALEKAKKANPRAPALENNAHRQPPALEPVKNAHAPVQPSEGNPAIHPPSNLAANDGKYY